MNVFVLGTGRCGTKTFAVACSHLTNYTAGHETRVRRVVARLDYPENHIESDPRLSWHVGELALRYPDAYYVHLIRRPEEVIASLMLRWNTSKFLRFLRLALVNREERDYSTEEARRALCELYVRTVTANVGVFLTGAKRMMVMELHRAKEQFPRFLSAIGAEGDLAAAAAEWDVRHNASRR